MTISRDDWLRAIADLDVDEDPEALTLAELGQLFGMKRTATLGRVRALIEAGRACQVKKRALSANGRHVLITAFRLLDTSAGVAHGENHT